MVWKAEYALLILTSTIVDYYAALEMEKLPLKKDRRALLITRLFTNLGLLFVF
jgi:alginate O-acetyltransferase complex protein AlgI